MRHNLINFLSCTLLTIIILVNNAAFCAASEYIEILPEDETAATQNYFNGMYENKKIQEQDYSEFIIYSAAQGYPWAQTILGMICYERQDYSEAASWYKKAAEQGDAVAQYNLGDLYFHGKGVKQNYSEAHDWYIKAANQGIVEAQCSLGNMYLKGNGIEQDKFEAFYWYKKAAEQGDAQSQYNLGAMYYDGKGVKQDKKEGIKWIKKAADHGNEFAQKILKEIDKPWWSYLLPKSFFSLFLEELYLNISWLLIVLVFFVFYAICKFFYRIYKFFKRGKGNF